MLKRLYPGISFFRSAPLVSHHTREYLCILQRPFLTMSWRFMKGEFLINILKKFLTTVCTALNKSQSSFFFVLWAVRMIQALRFVKARNSGDQHVQPSFGAQPDRVRQGFTIVLTTVSRQSSRSFPFEHSLTWATKGGFLGGIFPVLVFVYRHTFCDISGYNLFALYIPGHV